VAHYISHLPIELGDLKCQTCETTASVERKTICIFETGFFVAWMLLN